MFPYNLSFTHSMLAFLQENSGPGEHLDEKTGVVDLRDGNCEYNLFLSFHDGALTVLLYSVRSTRLYSVFFFFW